MALTHARFKGCALDTDSTKGQEYSEINICYKGVCEVVTFTVEEQFFFPINL